MSSQESFNEPSRPRRPNAGKWIALVIVSAIVVGRLVWVSQSDSQSAGALTPSRSSETASPSSSPTPASPSPALFTASLDWTASVGEGKTSISTDGTNVFVSNANTLSSFPVRCVKLMGVCKANFVSSVPRGNISRAAAMQDLVYVSTTGGGLYAFPVSCKKAECPPAWIGYAESGVVSAPAATVDFVYVAGRDLSAFPSNCGTGNARCPSAWSASLPGRAAATAPAVGGGLVIVATSNPDGTGAVSAYPAACTARCTPVWTGSTQRPTSGVTIYGTRAYAVSKGSVYAFPLSCQNTCEPAWKGDFTSGPPLASAKKTATAALPTAGKRSLYVASPDGGLWVFPSKCPTSICQPIRRIAIGSATLSSPVTRNGAVFVVSSAGFIAAVPDGCVGDADECRPTWTDALSASATASPAAATDMIFVADDAGTVYAYSIKRP